MNVEGLTRENVASHLQKYRLYLKRISSVATQQTNMVAALGGKDAAYMRMSTLDGIGDSRAFTGSGRLSSPAFSSYTQGGMLGRLNSPAGINLRNLASSTLLQPHAQNLNNSTSTIGKLQPAVSPANQTATLFQGVPSSLELDHLQQNKCATRVGDFNPIDESRIFGAASAFTDTRALAINTNNYSPGAPNNPMMLQGNSQRVVTGRGFVDQSSVSLATFPSESFHRDVGETNDNWQSAIPLSKFPSNALANEFFCQGQLPLSNVRDSNSSAGPRYRTTPLVFPSTATTSASLEDSSGEIQCEEGLIGDSFQNLSQAAPVQLWGVT
ncbi:hypothetical protein ACH5RR_003522 [Cinchona calisaya]|uniref:Uncharacterized protein n=1 Tax=Cinchona calisaya TaxID=153742 RepID=A0ABD3AV32_9GENT